MPNPETTAYHAAASYARGLQDAALICAAEAVRLISNGRARVKLADRLTAEVLRSMERKILALKDCNHD